MTFKLRWQHRTIHWLGGLNALLLLILKYPLGRKVNPQADPYASIRGYKQTDLLPPDALEPGKPVQLFGYQTSPNVLFTFSLFFIVAATGWEVSKSWLAGSLHPPLWNSLNAFAHLFANTLFATCVVIVGLGTLERLLPLAIWKVINKVIAWRSRVFGTAMVEGLNAWRDAECARNARQDGSPREQR